MKKNNRFFLFVWVCIVFGIVTIVPSLFKSQILFSVPFDRQNYSGYDSENIQNIDKGKLEKFNGKGFGTSKFETIVVSSITVSSITATSQMFGVINASATSMNSSTNVSGTFATLTGSPITLVTKKAPSMIRIVCEINCLRNAAGTDNARVDVTMDGNQLKQVIEQMTLSQRKTFIIDFTTITTAASHAFTLRANTDIGNMDCPSQIGPTDSHDFIVREIFN